MADASIGPPSQAITVTIAAGETASQPFRLAGYFIAAHAGLTASVAVHTFTDNPSDGEFVRIEGYTFWFRTVAVVPEEDVEIQGTLALTIAELLSVVAVAVAAELFTTDVVVTAGPGADQITVTQTGANPDGDYSSDSGTWDVIPNPGDQLPNPNVGLYTSFDAGVTWQPVSSDDPTNVTYGTVYLSCQATDAQNRRATEGLDYCRLQWPDGDDDIQGLARSTLLILAQI